MIEEACTKLKRKFIQIIFILWEVKSHIVGYPTVPLIQATGTYLTTLPSFP